jgi:hypothetical protein
MTNCSLMLNNREEETETYSKCQESCDVELQATGRAVELLGTRHGDLRGLRGKGLTTGSDVVPRGRNRYSGTLPGYMRECDAVWEQLLLTQAALYTEACGTSWPPEFDLSIRTK